MREEEGIVGDEEGRTEETPSSSSTIPPDHLRCRGSGSHGWRCKSWRFHPSVSVYCEKHYNLRRKSREKEKEKKRLGKRRRVFSSTDDHDEKDDSFILSKKTRSRNSSKASESKEMEKYSISELIIHLKSSSRKQEFDNVAKILQMREDKLKMEKQEAEKQAALFKEELGIFKTMCLQLTSVVEEKKKKKKATFEVKDNVAEMEIKILNIEQELKRCKEINNVGRLEKELEIVGERERRSEERFTKMSWDLRERISELERKNRELEASKRRDEGGTEVSKKRFEQSESQSLLEPQASREIHEELRGSQFNVSCLVEGKNNESEIWRAEGVNEMEATKHDRGFYAPPNSDSISVSLTRARIPEEAMECENKQTKTQSETSCVPKDACSPNLKEASNCGGRMYGSAKVDLDCCSPSGESRVPQLAGVTKKSESKQIIFQNEANALEGATLSQIKIKEEALNCDEKLCTCPILDSVCHSARSKNFQESPLSRQKSISPLVSEERKGSEVRHTRFQNEDSCALSGAKFSQVKIREEALNCVEKLYTSASGDSVHHSTRGENTKESTPSRQGLTSLQQSNENESTQTKFQSEASCALSGVKLSQVEVKEEPWNCHERFSASASVDSTSHSIGGDNVKDASISRSRSILLQQFEQKRSAAEQILSNQFEIIGTSCKQSRNSIAENDGEKVTKELGADCDGISAFLCELRRFKANKANMTLKHL